ncbi:DUF2442 domain-containing protein [Fredinandcohnia sp. SECRCQ15]|uniref:DUF2442 domain-containing protein n=1 Tax=Fredinandcohnia quinoae TaxID=2918902 RepID=A0AAW5EC32_9BACI|nr:DUF2442 domain-containing protein [Fredinandcohnia sp. SECRCQ15]MCH1627235.1 DUF2442 domain-containing protein [Fredinandcohnia sp. SECRCQ15]
MVRVLSFYPTKTFKLILEFENSDYRLLDMREFLHNKEGLMKEIINDIEVFMTAKLDEVAGTVMWANDVDFDPGILYESSISLDELINNDSTKNKKARGLPIPKKITKLPDDYESEISRQNRRLIKLLRGL